MLRRPGWITYGYSMALYNHLTASRSRSPWSGGYPRRGYARSVAGRVMCLTAEKNKKENIEQNLLTRAIARCILVLTINRKGNAKMKITAIIEKIMQQKGISKAALGRAVGISGDKNKSQPTDTINKRLKQKDITVSVAAEMVGKMDYKIVIVPGGVTVKDDWYEVGGDDNE